MRQLLHLVSLATLVSNALAGPNLTQIHEKGRCAIRGQCGKKSFFGAQLPCLDNGKAKEPTDAIRKKLVDTCGEKWGNRPVCCDEDQLDAMIDKFSVPDSLTSPCPACKNNFFNLFCTFTCSPDQSLFVNVTKTQELSKGKDAVAELNYLVTDEYGSGFYDSCKDVKFSATNGFIMDLLGGGAKNYTAFLKFLGDEKALGSPFQMNFPRPRDIEDRTMAAMHDVPKKCNDEDEKYRCSCVDCPATCPALSEVSEGKRCRVGVLPCLTFAAVLVYSVLVLIAIAGGVFHIAWMKHSQRRSERLRLLQDAAPSDDEDEGDVIHNAGMFDRPQSNYRLNSVLDKAFNRLGRTSARYPGITIGASILLVGLLSLGWIRFAVETNPVRLWVSSNSAAAEEKAFFDDNFGPFYRAEQAFLVNDTGYSDIRPVLSYETLTWWFDVENRIKRLRSPEYGVTIDDVCFKPTGDACVFQSVSGYFSGGLSSLNPSTWKQKIQKCTDDPADAECLPDFNLPLKKEMVLGGWEKTDDVLDSQALISTWVINNHAEGSEAEAKAMDWEQTLKSTLLTAQASAKDKGLRLSFSTEISLEEELNKSTNTDAKIVVISYLVMFLYASVALGSTTLTIQNLLRNPTSALVMSKFSLGVAGIVIVLMSVSASVGLFSAFGVKVTLIIAEVIPFLVLAVGVDNIFLIVHEFERVDSSHPDELIVDRVGKALGRMGPSILLSASTETVAFALGAFAGMPAVRNFAIYAAGAVFINAVLQVTMFVSVLALNQRRVEDNRADCFPCLKLDKTGVGNATSRPYQPDSETTLQRFIRKVYAPGLLQRKMKAVVIMAFLGLFTAGVSLIPEVALGLDQRIAIPKDSYLIPYFNDLYEYFNTGPPVYFVTRELNVTERKHQQELCGRFTTCDEYSLTTILEQERKRPGVSHIGEPAASWIDDFFFWLNPLQDKCCKNGGKVCFEDRNPPWNITLSGMPEGTEFIEYLGQWIRSPTNQDCIIAGEAAYSHALVIDETRDTINASHFRSSHRPLRSQEDFIEAYASARRISDSISENIGTEVFPYSKFYIFFDQYTTIVKLTATLLGSAIALILIITSILLGSIRTGIVVTVTVTMIVIDIVGTMAVAGVSLNAVSLVNLVICVGIGVEFCAHIARAFMFPSRNVMERAKNKFRGKDARAWTALVNVGGSVFSGITITKFLGVFILAFTRSKIFEIYYFRIWLALVILAAAHALIFLPVALSIFGGEGKYSSYYKKTEANEQIGYMDPESDGGLEEDLAARRYRALLPEDDFDSDEDY